MWSALTAPVDRTRRSHVVATYDLAGVRVLPRLSSRAYVAIGSNTSGWLRYDSGIDEVATYTRTLTAAEVAEHDRIGTTGR